MELQNIGASNRDDAFYRYKMPKMLTKIEGRGNGIKTNIVNMVEIAKALARPPSYTTKYFGTELGAQSKFDEKTGTSLVNGSHDTAKLAGLLEIFIKKYVQCYGCKNPETEIIITKNQMIQLKCAACGFVSDVDMKDKLTTFILKNPPESKKGSKDKKALRRAEKERMKEGEAADEEAKKGKKDAAAKKKPSSKDAATKSSSKKKAGSSDEERSSPPRSHTVVKDQDDDDDDDDVEWQTDTSLEAAKLRIQEQLNAVTADMVMLVTDEPESKAKASKAAPGSPKGSSPPPENVPAPANGVAENYAKVLQEVKMILKKGVTTTKQLKSSLASVAGTPQEVMSALFEAVLGDLESELAERVKKMKIYFAALASEDPQMLLLHAVEQFFRNSDAGKAAGKNEIAIVVKALYDGDMLEEDNIVKWYEAGLVGAHKDSAVWKNIKPLIEWLQQADSESEEE